MQKNIKWYDLRKTNEGYKVFYSISTRIQAIFLLIITSIMLYFQIFEITEKVNIFGLIIFGLIFTLSFIFSFFIDSFMFLFNKSCIIRKIGILPFIIIKKIELKEIQSISTDIVEKIDKRYSVSAKENIPEGYYSGKTKEYMITVELTNGQIYKISFGKGREELFNKFLEEIKKFI